MKTHRLNLRRPRMSDSAVFFEMENDPEVYRYLPPGRPFSQEEVDRRLKEMINEELARAPFGVWVVEHLKSQEAIGWALLMKVAEDDHRLGYVIRKKFWGQGYATEIAKAVADFGISKGLSEIFAVTSPDNLASSKVLEKIGFKFKEFIPGEQEQTQLRLYCLKADTSA